MESSWTALLEVAGQLYLFALGTQCTLTWIFSLQFLAFQRSAEGAQYFRSWTGAWFTRAIALTAILLCFFVPPLRGASPDFREAGPLSIVGFSVYQVGKFLSAMWFLEGALLFRGTKLSRNSRLLTAVALVAAALASVSFSRDIEELMACQAAVVISTAGACAFVLHRLPHEQRSLGTRLSALAFALQAGLWLLYLCAYMRPGPEVWPNARTVWTFLLAHNSYFDLTVDVLVASSLVVLLLQAAHRRQMRAEAERGSLQVVLGQTERLRSLGTLVSGVAHELNNPLTAILGFSETLTLAHGDGECAHGANVIREQALRCRRIVRGLTTFSGKGTEVFELVEIGALLARVAQGFEFELAGHRLRLAIQTPAELPPLMCDRFAIEQLVTNLLANAIQASPPGATVGLSAHPDERSLEIVVEDEGPGIPAELLPHLFDPFFTTKPPGQGMGLGLSVAHGIAVSHDGWLRAENRSPNGARMIVRLPRRTRSQAEAEPLPQKELAPARRAGAPRSIELLVIEDEALLCEMVVSMGRHRGWRVSTAGTGRAGLARLRSEGRRYDVVLCDLRMATPSGIEIHDILMHEDPELLERFLFVTGDHFSDEAESFARRCHRPILQKPFQLADLATRVEELAAIRV